MSGCLLLLSPLRMSMAWAMGQQREPPPLSGGDGVLVAGPSTMRALGESDQTCWAKLTRV